ncbi:Serine/threonine-protein kinase fray1 [Sesamum angolense]|uniref:Serine/threonine-protein kinase fray1 n=1 Tax=Sesamum angolense TaxID=2727404 RepID=A0AAE1T4H0_9LAMI|nr:Serine/threonine-protein kinase fray1 [Sesamum angolense]
MQVKELEKIETSDLKEQENLERTEEVEALGENCGKKDLNFNSIIDVSGKRLDFPLINGEESTVEEVYLYKNELDLIPRAVGRLKGLRTLKFFANEVNLFPVEFTNLVQLECLQVKVTEPGVSGLKLSKLGNLKELELSRVPPRPSSFPILSEIAGLKCLTRLSVCHFSIRYLPPEIGCLINLEYLDLSFNKMRNLPDEIALLDMLISLKVANNKLAELPLGLSSLQRLENLDLSNNRLTSLGCLELEVMRNLQTLYLQHNQMRGIQIPSWICCKLEGNCRNPSNDESAEMDVYEGGILEIHSTPSSSIAPSSHLSGLSPSNRCLAARRAKGWKRRYNLKTKARQERLINCKKWKVDTSSRSSFEKCTTCSVSVKSDNATSQGLSVIADAELDNKDIFSEEKIHGNSLVTPRNVDFTAKNKSVDGCSCSEIDADGTQKDVEAEGLHSVGVDSLSHAVEVLDEGSSSEASNYLLKSKRHSDKDLDNPKPTKYRRPTNDPSYLSRQYSEISFCGVMDHLPDGFYDAGRDRPFMPLASYEKNLYVNSREVILLDRERDEDLDAILLCARALVCRFRQMNSSIDEHSDSAIDNLQTASLLTLFVSDHFGGSDKSVVLQRTRKDVSGSNCRKPFVCTCATGTNSDANKANKLSVDPVEDTIFRDICEKGLQSMKERRNSIVVPIGSLQFGVCRHRALLMKYLCDRMEPRIPCELVRGYLDFSPHAWNVIIIKRGESLVRMIVDACHPHDIREESDPEYFCRYIPLSRVSALVADCDAGPNCSFPSLSLCDEIGKLASTSLMRCNFGSLQAAVKVRTIDVTGASADEVRNFEFSCLGEVRMLSFLKHSCIIEFYGHQISSKWSLTEDGNSGGRILQSAILMGTYVERLSSSGEKHVALDLALSIARDVAFALTELHAKHIIHRDIKSENVLIDLEKKRQDGTPVVKICDFDRAIPLHSYSHTCCIAHVGVPPADICVGTPRWMAPEADLRILYCTNSCFIQPLLGSGYMVIWLPASELLTLQVPYFGLPESDIHESLQMGQRPKLTEELEALAQSDGELETESETLRFLVKLYHQCTEKDPADRPSAEKIYNSLLARASSVTDSTNTGQE